MDFKGIDLNLLAAFDALMIERNVTRAAARVGVSQPAMSAALSRLRVLLADPLFIRSAHGLLPTAKSRELAEPVAQALRQIEVAFLPKPLFDPSTASMTFTLGLVEYQSMVLLPRLTAHLALQGAGLSVSVCGVRNRDHAIELLDAGTIDAAVGVLPMKSENRILAQPVMQDEFVTIVRKGHPLVEKDISLETFLSLQHILISPEGDRHGFVDQALAKEGKSRTLALTLPHMFAVPSVIANSDLTATVLKRVVAHSPAQAEILQLPPPIELPTISFDLIWHKRNDSALSQRWFREQISILASTF
ncbi:LysR family transcriptional regulator [Marinomonas pollencensis]|uniref:LysR family transcriptional regulator n=1 Tax=Marinomonas pollencensis TaxID=491954 RepID=A0A3E0DT16_9GAMM|nr:LysR family transcriptional regulator [Marinomonas pollencensis]REG86630.1 LysR family transcriptional regulator [Marinomonas pollencensis]